MPNGTDQLIQPPQLPVAPADSAAPDSSALQSQNQLVQPLQQVQQQTEPTRKEPTSFGMRVATSDDVQQYNSYIQNGGDPNQIPVYDRLAVAIAKNPNLLKEDRDIYYNLVFKPLQAQSIPAKINEAVMNLPGTIKDTVTNIGQGIWNSVNLLKDNTELAFRKVTGIKHDPGYESLTSRLATEAATQAQGIGGAISDAYNFVTGTFNGLIQTTRPVAEFFVSDPKSKEEIDRQYSSFMQNTVADQQDIEKLGNHFQEFTANAYKTLGAADVGQKTATAQPNQAAAAGIATIFNPLNFVPELRAAGELSGVVRPIFFEKGMQAMEDLAGAKARKLVLDTSQILPANAELSAANAGYVEARTLQANFAPATRAATQDVAEKTANLNQVLTSINKIGGDPGAATTIASKALQGTGVSLEALGNAARSVSQLPEAFGNWVSGGNEAVKNIITEGAKKFLFGTALEHLGPVGGFIETVLEHSPDLADNFSGLLKTAGKELMYADATIPYGQRLYQQVKGMPKFMAAAIDSPLVQMATSAVSGGVGAGVTGAVLGGLQEAGSVPGGGPGGAVGGFAQGGILGMAHGGFGQWQRFQNPNQYFLAARSDFKRYRDTLSTNKVVPLAEAPPPGVEGAVPRSPLLGSERDNFDRLSPTNQIILAQSAQHFPGLKVNYAFDPTGAQGFHFFDNGGRSNIQINLANQDSVVRTIMAHELMHGATHSGMLPDLYDSLFGNPQTGKIGQFTAVDAQGKPIDVNPATGRYYTNQDFNNLAEQYKNRMTQNGLPTSHLDDFAIAKEIYAEHGVDYMLSGAPILDSNSAFRPLFANGNAIKTALAKIGYTFDEAGRPIGAPGSMVSGSGLFSDLQRNPALNQLAQSYFRTKWREGTIDSEEQPTHRFTQKDMQNPNVADTFLTNASEIRRNPDGTAMRDPLTGLPIYRSPKEVKDYNAGFANAMRSGLEALPEDQRMDLGFRGDSEGNMFMRYLPDNVLDSMATTNQYNPHQIASLKLLSRVLADKGQPGMEMRFFYNKALTAGKKYRGFEGAEKIAVPYGIEITKDNQVNIKSVDFNQLTNNYLRMRNRGPFKTLWDSPDAFAQDAHTYFTNHANGRPGADAIGVEKRNAINALSNFQVAEQQEMNPLVGTVPASVRSIIKSYRIDRANQISATGAVRPFISADQYYMMKRNYMPGAAEVSYMPRAASSAEPAAPPDKTAIPVTMRTTRTGKEVAEEIPYNIAGAPLVANKQPAGLSKDSPNDFSHVDFLGKLDQQRLTHLDNASATGAYAKKIVAEFAKWKDNPDVMAAKPWYTDVRAHLESTFGDDAELFAHLLAATSPRQGVVENWHDALEAYRRYRSGAFDEAIQRYKDTGKITEDMKPKKENGAKFGMNSDAVLKVLAGTWLDSVEGPKTPNFFDNLFGRGTDATIDSWAARTMRRLGYNQVKGGPKQWRIQPASEPGVSNLDFAFSQEAFRRASDKLGMDPHELQAVMWYAEKHHWAEQGWAKGGAAAAKASYVPMLKSLAGNVKSGTPLMEAIQIAGKK